MLLNREPTFREFGAPTVPAGLIDVTGRGAGRGFTLLELILTMALLTIVISLSAPALANFFRGRSLDSEARRLLALTRQGQSRAISEGVPVELWIDSEQHRFGLEAEPSYEPQDLRALEFELAPEMSLEILEAEGTRSSLVRSDARILVREATVLTRRPGLPRIRFLPDGSITESSPFGLRLTGPDGAGFDLVQTRNRLRYEIQSANN